MDHAGLKGSDDEHARCATRSFVKRFERLSVWRGDARYGVVQRVDPERLQIFLPRAQST
jgi:hypothetical protein